MNHSDPMFKRTAWDEPEYHLKCDSDLSRVDPDPDYVKFVGERNRRDISESQKLAKLLKPVPKRDVKGLVSTEAPSSKSLSAPATAFVECFCGPNSLLSAEASAKGLKILRIIEKTHEKR